MPLIQGQETVGASSRGQYHEGCVREPDPKIPVPTDHLRGLLHVLGSETLESIGTSRDLAQEEEFRSRTDPFQEQVVDLGGNEWRQQERPRIRFEGSLHIFMSMLTCVDEGEDAAGI